MATALLSTVLMGLFLLAVAVALRRGGWREYTVAGETDGGSLLGVLRSPTAWMIGFFLAVGLLVGGAVLYVSDASLPVSTSLIGLGLGGLSGLLIIGFIYYGLYEAARSWGYESAPAAMVGAWGVGTVVLVGIVVKLLVDSL